MPQRSSWILAAGGLAALFAPAVHGHIFAVQSRQYYNSGAYQEESYPNYEKWTGAYNAGGQVEVQKRAERLTDPAILARYGNGYYPLRWVYDLGEMAPNGNFIEPQGISVRHGVCGDPRSGDQGGKDGDNVYSTPNKDWPILQEFTQGQVMEVRVVMKAYHWGHLEFFLCDAEDLEDPDGVVTQECLNKYPLTRADGDGVNSPIDPNHPGRYYVDPPCRENETEQYEDEQYWRAGGGYVMTMNYQLPPGLSCERCILQMVNFTGHKCRVPGYEEFNPPSWPSQCAPNKEDWVDMTVPYCGDEKWNLAEEFWNCSDITIKADGSTPPTTPSPEAPPAETPAPVDETTEPPVDETTPSPVAEPTPAPVTAVAPSPAPVMPVAPTPSPVMPVAPTATTEPPVDMETAEPTTAMTTEPVTMETAEPTTAMTTEPVTMEPATPAPVGEDVEAESLGCFHDNKDDRVLGDKYDDPDMDTKMCFDYCTELGAAFMATQWGFECWCSPDGGLDYNRHYETIGADAVCDTPCMGDETEICGGYDSFELYKLAPASSECSTPVEAYEQCGGEDWTGSTCCSDGYECVDVSGEGCYEQCRPASIEGTTPSPIDMETPTPAPASMDRRTPSPVAETAPPIAETAPPVAETAPPVTETAPPVTEPTPSPVTEEPVAPPTGGGGSAPADMQDYLDLHNEARCIHNADPLTWDSAVAASAAVHAKRMSDSCSGLFHSESEQRNGWGENISWCGRSAGCSSAEKTMTGWYNDEIKSDSVTGYEGHATQILWKSTEKLGCAVSSCSSGSWAGDYVVCQYDPAGNYMAIVEQEVDLPTNAGNC